MRKKKQIHSVIPKLQFTKKERLPLMIKGTIKKGILNLTFRLIVP